MPDRSPSARELARTDAQCPTRARSCPRTWTGIAATRSVTRVSCALAVALLLGRMPASAEDDRRAAERGLPAVTVVSNAALGSSQVFGLAVSGARLYVATLSGVSVFDGAHWTAVGAPRASYAIAASAGGRVLTGGPDALADLRRLPDGRFALQSLLQALPEAERSIGDVRSIHAFGRTFLVVTDRCLLLVDNAHVRTVAQWPSDARRRAFAAAGLLHVVSGRHVDAFAPDGSARPDDLAADAATRGRIAAIGDGPAGARIVAIEDGGLFAVRDGTWTPIPDTEAALRPGVADLRLLASGAVAVATHGGGIVLLSPALLLDRVLGRAEGLPSPHVDALAEDREGGLWSASESALARVDLAGPLSLLDARVGLEGTVNGVLRHHDRLHVMTSAGMYVLDGGHGGSQRASLVPGITGRVWDGLAIGDELLVATSAGVFEVHADVAHRVRGTAHLSAYALAAAADRPGTVLVGSRSGLSTLTRDAAGWRFERDVNGAPRYSRSIVARPRGEVVIGSVFDGAVRLSLTGAFPPTSYGAGEVRVRATGGAIEVLQSEPAALFVLDDDAHTLRPAPHAERPLGDVVLEVADDRDGGMWAIGHGAVRFPAGEATPRTVLDRSVSVQAVDVDDDGVVWLATGVGLWRYTGEPARAGTPATPTLERVILDDRPATPWGPDGRALTLPFGLERLRLEFAPNTFAAGASTEFRLAPIDTGWSPLRRGHSAEYTSLPEGDYALHLRPAGRESDATVWSFSVRPPWYRTPLVRALQILIVAIGALLVAQWRTARLRHRSRELEAAVATQTEALRDANRRLADMASRDDLTGLFNRRHLDAMLADEWARAHRQRRPIGLVMVDIDHFKRLNDTRGHVAGDAALRQVAGVIADCARRPGDAAARFGGEEFVVLLPGARPDYVYGLAEEIRASVERLAVANPETPLQYVTVSVGVAAVDAPLTLEPTLLATADGALYRAKEAGRNLVAA